LAGWRSNKETSQRVVSTTSMQLGASTRQHSHLIIRQHHDETDCERDGTVAPQQPNKLARQHKSATAHSREGEYASRPVGNPAIRLVDKMAPLRALLLSSKRAGARTRRTDNELTSQLAFMLTRGQVSVSACGRANTRSIAGAVTRRRVGVSSCTHESVPSPT